MVPHDNLFHLDTYVVNSLTDSIPPYFLPVQLHLFAEPFSQVHVHHIPGGDAQIPPQTHIR